MVSIATTASQICSHYTIPLPAFQAYPAWERAMFRMAYAVDVLHVEEQPIGSNSGPDVDRYLRSCGLNPGQPWCAAMYTCMLSDSGVSHDQLSFGAASTHEWKNHAIAKGWVLPKPVRGCVGIIIESASAGHLILVTDEKTHPGRVLTLEGNTNTDGGREGYMGARHNRDVDQIDTWIDTTRFVS